MFSNSTTAALDQQLEFIANKSFRIAVSRDADPEFKAYVLAAGKAHSLGYRSVDNLLKRYGDRWTREFSDKSASNRNEPAEVRSRVVVIATRRCIELSQLKLPSDVPCGVIAAANALIRLESTFRSCSHLLWLGHPTECAALARLGLEQIAWSYAIREIDDVNDVLNSSITKSITAIKSIFPHFGRLYERLSRLAHVSPDTHHRFVKISDGSASVQIQTPEAPSTSLTLLLILLDCFLVTSEVLFKKFGLSCRNTEAPTNQPRKIREVDKIIEEFPIFSEIDVQSLLALRGPERSR